MAAVLGVHESTIWPNRYFVNGVSIDSSYNVEQRSDEELLKLNEAVSGESHITVIRSWDAGDKCSYVPESVTEGLDGKFPVDDDGRFVIPLNGEYPDVPALADERAPVADVRLPVGMKLD